MDKSHTCESIVLASYDIGEADRFLIILTRERGRLAARAAGARRPRSRLNGLLPLTRSLIDIREHGGSFLVTAMYGSSRQEEGKIEDFLTGMQANDLLLSLLHDGEPFPEIFDALSAFLKKKNREPCHLLSFVFRLLFLLGVLSLERTAEPLSSLTTDERVFVEQSARGHDVEDGVSLKRLLPLARKLVEDHGTRPLKSADVAAACAASRHPAG